MPNVECVVYQVLDVNLNRVREGLRVVEEAFRFVYRDKRLTDSFRVLRHELSHAFFDMSSVLIAARDVDSDLVAEDYSEGEAVRRTVIDVLVANLQRSKEGFRVLEEYGKLVTPDLGAKMQSLRFRFYRLEQDVFTFLNNSNVQGGA